MNMPALYVVDERYLELEEAWAEAIMQYDQLTQWLIMHCQWYEA